MAGLVALAVVAAYLVGRAGPAPASAETSDGTSTVTVTGVGHVAVVPDQLAFDLSVSVLRDDLDQALDDSNTAMQSVVDTLKCLGVADKDVQTTDLSMNPEYSQEEGQPPVLTGYRVSHSVSVTVEDFAKASDIVTAALDAGGTGVRLNGLRLQVGDPDGVARAGPHRRLRPGPRQGRGVRRRTRAASSARSSGSARSPTSPTTATELAYRRRGQPPSAAFPIQAGQQDLTANVVVVYELK